jgi:Skp family chaperone for outer membrane proteins
VNAQLSALGAAAPQGSHLSAGTQAKIAQIDKQYKAQFAADVKKTIEEFNTTRADLDTRFQALRGANTSSQGSVSKQLSELHKQRDQLYNQIIAQVKREVQTMASQRGLKIVFDTPVAPVGGIDLTADVQKDVESLHE